MLSRMALMLLSFVSASALSSASERRPFEGVWAKSERECRDEEGPNSRTMIDMRDPKVGPLFDQYENHCRVHSVVPSSNQTFTLKVTCHEFWEEFQKRQSGQAMSIRLQVRGVNSIMLDGVRYLRCIR